MNISEEPVVLEGRPDTGASAAQRGDPRYRAMYPAVYALLRHLEQVGFEAAPLLVG